MKLRRLVTRRAKWVGLVATVCLAVAMVASYWYWPTYQFTPADSRTNWRADISPGVISFVRHDAIAHHYFVPIHGWRLDSRQARASVSYSGTIMRQPPRHPPAWLPTYTFLDALRSRWWRLTVPLWIPLILVAVLTVTLFYRDCKPKPGCCTKCRYDLTGLSGDTCPECGNPTGCDP